MIKKKIFDAIVQELPGVTFSVDRPKDMSHGDYATNAALAAAQMEKKNPRELAEALAAKLSIDGVKKIEVAGAGFINFTLAGNTVKDVVHEAHEAGWGKNSLHTGKKIMVEYTDPNPFKEFHIGHLMSNAIGESVARLLEISGAKVERANYQGDVGPHVAKAIWGKMQQPELAWGAAYTYGDSQYETHKADVDAINTQVYDRSDEKINELYDRGRKESLERFEEIYKILGTKFDHYFFESATAPKGWEIVKAHPEIFEESEGATVFKGEQYGLHTRVFITKNKLPTYETKDLGLLELKKEVSDPDLSITVTANEQKDYFKVVLEAAKHLPELQEFAAKTQHVSHGMMRFAEGKMSSRKGNVITGESLLADLTKEAREREDVAVGAIKYVVLRSGSGKDIIFDPEKSLSLEGDSGPYVQYALVRARSLLRNAAEAKIVDPEPAGPMLVERLIVHFPSVVERAAIELEPHYVVTYLTELAAAFNSWYASERFIVDGTITTRRVAVLKAIENTLAKGLEVLGIPTPEKM